MRKMFSLLVQDLIEIVKDNNCFHCPAGIGWGEKCDGNLPDEECIEVIENHYKRKMGYIARDLSSFNVGDKIRVKQWVDMVEEFGFSPDGENINTTSFFKSEMKDLCGRFFIIDEIKKDGRISLGGSVWYVTAEMIKPA